MSGSLSTTLTASMESINVEETASRTPCDEAEKTNPRPQASADAENAQDSPHTEQASTEMETLDTVPESDSSVVSKTDSSETPQQHKPAQEPSNSPKDAVAGKKKVDESFIVSPTSLKRKCRSLDESRLRKNQKERQARLAEKKLELEAEEAAKKKGTGPQYFVKDWLFLHTLGEGAYGEVKLAYNDKTEEAVAVKIINTRGASKSTLDDIRKEICIHRMLFHKNVIRFWGMRKEGYTQYLFLQYACRGELFDKIDPDVGMPQAQAQRYFRQLVDGLDYLHKKGVAHRDIKPENLLLDVHDNLKIADFGLATVFRHQGKWRYLDRFCGSVPYLAPEVMASKPYRAEPADIWSSGLVLVAMLGGELPWNGAVSSDTDYCKWRECHIENRPWNKIDNLALCLLRRVLTENPEKRYTIVQIRKNQWFAKDFSEEAAKQLSAGPKRQRTRTSESEQSPGGVSCSQPTMPSVANSNSDGRKSANGRLGCLDSCAAEDGPISFSQPAQADDMLLSSQLNSTQSSQTPMQKLVRRMTRFFCCLTRGEVMEELSHLFDRLDYTWKHTTSHLMTVHTVDRRQSPLIFKAMILEMGENLLVDFRLSKGDGLEFKRQFMRIRELMKDVICKVPPSWPNM